MPSTLGRIAGGALLAIVLVAVVLPWVWRRPLTIRGWTVPPPRPRIAIAQVVVGVVDWIVAATVLYVLMPSSAPITFAHFAALFVVAQVAGVSSHVPGGLGVFETVILLALAPRAHSPALVGALLVYRLVYYVLPLAVATLLLVAYEIRQRSARLVAVRRGRRPLDLGDGAAGDGAGDLRQRRPAALLRRGPPPRRPPRHAARRPADVRCSRRRTSSRASRASACILLASGLQRRLDAAYHLAVALLTAGAVLALLKGFDYEESLFLVAMLGVLRAVPRRVQPPRIADRRALHARLGRGGRGRPAASRRGSASSCTSTPTTRASCGGSSVSSATRRASCVPASASRWSRWRSRSGTS